MIKGVNRREITVEFNPVRLTLLLKVREVVVSALTLHFLVLMSEDVGQFITVLEAFTLVEVFLFTVYVAEMVMSVDVIVPMLLRMAKTEYFYFLNCVQLSRVRCTDLDSLSISGCNMEIKGLGPARDHNIKVFHNRLKDFLRFPMDV